MDQSFKNKVLDLLDQFGMDCLFYLVLFLQIWESIAISCSSNPLKKVYNESRVDISACNNIQLDFSDSDTERNLTNLQASSNKLEIMVKDVFIKVTGLTTIDMRNNRINTFQNGAFNGLGKLQELLLSQNRIKTIPLGTFDPLTALTLLSLQQNRIEILQNGIFDKNGKLSAIYLDENELEEIEDKVFQNNFNLHVSLDLNICYNGKFDVRHGDITHRVISKIMNCIMTTDSNCDLNEKFLKQRGIYLGGCSNGTRCDRVLQDCVLDVEYSEFLDFLKSEIDWLIVGLASISVNVLLSLILWCICCKTKTRPPTNENCEKKKDANPYYSKADEHPCPISPESMYSNQNQFNFDF